jgi:hypothetical protein
LCGTGSSESIHDKMSAHMTITTTITALIQIAQHRSFNTLWLPSALTDFLKRLFQLRNCFSQHCFSQQFACASIAFRFYLQGDAIFAETLSISFSTICIAQLSTRHHSYQRFISHHQQSLHSGKTYQSRVQFPGN